jgi:hypothetical protein
LKGILIVTNNPKTFEKYPDARFVEGSPDDVVREASRMLLEGYILFSSPLPPNGRLMKNPFRSVVLKETVVSERSGKDFLLLKKAEEVYGRTSFLSIDGRRGADMAFIDLDLMESSLRDI